MKKWIATAVPVAVIASGGIAWAILSGTVVLPDVSQGVASTVGGGSCQGATSVNFTVPTPTWDNAGAEYVVSTLNYSNISTPCVNLGTADLQVYVTANGATIGSATASNLSSATGTLTLSQPIAYADITTASYSYLVSE